MKPYLLQHFLERAAVDDGTKVAFQHEECRLTFGELQTRALALGFLIRRLSRARGERVGILLERGLNQIVAMVGTLFADNVFVLLNPALHSRQIGHILRDCGISILITSAQFRDGVLAQTPETESVRQFLCEDQFPAEIPPGEDMASLSRNITDDVATIVYTSGSTGSPKGVVITHRNLVDTARNSAAHLGVQEDERILCCVPFNFDYGLNQFTTTLHKRCTLILHKFVTPKAFLQTIESERITGLPALPPIWAAVFNPRLCRLAPEEHDFSSLRYIANTGAKLSAPLVRKVRETFPHARLCLMYGFTEAFRSTFLDPREVDRLPDSIGKALPNVQIEVINEQGGVCAPGEIGELIHRGAGVTRGYWNSPELTAKLLRPNPLIDPPGSYVDMVAYSGDLVRKDAEGFLYYVGRKDHQIKTSGYRVSPTEIEALIMESGGVAEAVVFGLDDVALGQKVRALVTLNGTATIKEILARCRTAAPAYLVPSEMFEISSFAKTANGKIDRPKAVADSLATHGP